LPVTRPGRENETVVYRADIDGLRAVSILLVVGYHADFWLIRGGSIGVDVFFVISGFLISRIILTQIKTRTFSSAEFLCAPDSADISGAPRCAGRYLSDRLRVADSNQISRQVRKVPLADITRFPAQVCFTPRPKLYRPHQIGLREPK
jgi:hypothetical protein